MKYKLGTQRPLDLRDIRARKRPSLVGTFLLAPFLLLLAGLVVHLGWKISQHGMRVALPVAIGLGGAFAAWAFLAALPEPYGR